MSEAAAGLSIREVAEQTGVPQATLRVWESRYGFPEPARSEGGRRRFSRRDVELVRQVLEDRENGMSLQAAIERARRSEPRPEVSIFAGLRRRRPDIHPYLLPKRALIGLSHAIEDECCARAARPIIIGAFQQERFYRHAEPRWRDLARTAQTAFVFADFDERRDPEHAPVELPLASDEPLSREWSLVCEAADYSAALSAWERPGQDDVDDGLRLFETIWTVDPALVREAVRIGCELAVRSAPDVAAQLGDRLAQPPPATHDQLALIGALSGRMVAYVGAAAANGLPAPHPAGGD